MSQQVFGYVTERVLTALKNGVAPWRKPWSAGRPAANVLNPDRPYSGVNVWLTSLAGYECPYWITWNQVKKLGGSVLPGQEKEWTMVTFWKQVTRKAKDGEEEGGSYFLLRYYRLYNVAQCRLPEGTVPDWKAPSRETSTLLAAERIIDGMPNRPAYSLKGTVAAYSPARDEVVMPPQETFGSDEEFYSTAFHEFVHSTMHKTRLDRRAPSYGFEELVAELGAAFLQHSCGLLHATLENTAAYCDHWAKVIGADDRTFVRASSAAQKAVEYILAA